jgi:hypothetical protein
VAAIAKTINMKKTEPALDVIDVADHRGDSAHEPSADRLEI